MEPTLPSKKTTAFVDIAGYTGGMASFVGLLVYLAVQSTSTNTEAQIAPMLLPERTPVGTPPSMIWRETADHIEVHVTPAQHITHVAAEIDTDKQILTVGLRYKSLGDHQEIKKAPIGISLKAGFKVYRDTSQNEFDRLIFTHERPSAQWTEISLEALSKDASVAESHAPPIQSTRRGIEKSRTPTSTSSSHSAGAGPSWGSGETFENAPFSR